MDKSIKLNFSDKIKLNLFTKFRKIQTQLHELNYLFWECTLRCNIQCLHCGSDCHKDKKSIDMPAEDFLKATEEISKQYNPNKVMIVITGGEPLVRNDLEIVGKELYRQGYPWGMVTNGFALTHEKYNSLLDSGLRSVTISLDGLEKNHNWLRGNNKSFEKAVEAIKMVCSTKNMVYDVVTCVNKRNFNEIEQIKNLLIEIGVKYWRIFIIDPIGRAKYDKELQIDSKQLYSLMKFIENCRTEGKIKTSFGCEGFFGKLEGKVRDGYYFCRAGINIASILNDGSIGACPNNSREIIQGNIYKDSFLDVWNNKFDIMRNRNWAKEGTCKNCELFKYCLGNGLHLRDFDNNDVMRCHYKMVEEGFKEQI